MTAAYRLKGIGWMAVLLGIVLGFYLVSLRVAAERKTLDGVNARIESAERDIRALETEFDTRANLAQLEKWNGDTLALAAPTAAQFVRDDAQLASIDPNQLPGFGIKTAALVVPSMPVAPVVVAPAPVRVAAVKPVRVAVAKPVPVRVAAITLARNARSAPTPAKTRPTQTAVAETVAPTGRAALVMARLAEAARGREAVARVRPQAVAMLDRKLLSDTTFGDILNGARAEARKR